MEQVDRPEPDQDKSAAITLNVVVHDEKCAAHMKDVGIFVLYFCKKCIHSSVDLRHVTEHIPQCTHSPAETPKEKQLDDLLRNEAIEHIRESYDKQAERSSDTNVVSENTDEAVDSDNEADVSMLLQQQPEDTETIISDVDNVLNISTDQLYGCPLCPSVQIVNKTELDYHTKCHGLTGMNELDCYLCRFKPKRGTAKLNNWQALKNHLRKNHAIDFKLSCDICEMKCDSHSHYNRHLKSHRVKCKYKFCRYSKSVMASKSDLIPHEKCHNPNDTHKYLCYICGFESDKPTSWCRMSSHLESCHGDVLTSSGRKTNNCHIRAISSSANNVTETLSTQSAKTAKPINSIPAISESTNDNVSSSIDDLNIETLSCKLCPTAKMYSEVESEQHQKCHGENKKESLHCHLCKLARWSRQSRFKSWENLRTHLHVLHSVNFNLVCNLCGLTYDFHPQFNRHMRSHRPQCKLADCHYSRSSTQDVEAHEKCHKTDDPAVFACYICGYVNVKNPHKWLAMQTHLVSCHPGVLHLTSKDKKRFKTKDADSSGNSAADAACVFCNVLTPSSELSQHFAQHAEKEEVDEYEHQVLQKWFVPNSAERQSLENDGHMTEFCGSHQVSMSSLDEIVSHFLDHHWMRRGSSSKKRKLSYDMSIGGESSAGSDQVRCKQCYKLFANSQRLTNHMNRVHTPDKSLPVICSSCGKTFRNRNQWRNHFREIHEGKKRHRTRQKKNDVTTLHMCELCVYSTPSKLRLRNHQMSEHEGRYPHSCDKCEYQTNELSDFRRHKLKHAGIKRYACDYCSYKTSQRWILVSHCLKEHNIQMPALKRDTLGGPWSKRVQSMQERERSRQEAQVIASEPISQNTVEIYLDETQIPISGLVDATSEAMRVAEVNELVIPQASNIEQIVYDPVGTDRQGAVMLLTLDPGQMTLPANM